jgi:hypothetical protein
MFEGKARAAALLLLAASCGSAAAPSRPREPDCSGGDRYAANMTVAKLKNAGLFANQAVDLNRVEARMILSQRVSKGLYRQAFKVTIPRRGAAPITTVTISDASFEECSIAEPKVFLVAKEL